MNTKNKRELNRLAHEIAQTSAIETLSGFTPVQPNGKPITVKTRDRIIAAVRKTDGVAVTAEAFPDVYFDTSADLGFEKEIGYLETCGRLRRHPYNRTLVQIILPSARRSQ